MLLWPICVPFICHACSLCSIWVPICSFMFPLMFLYVPSDSIDVLCMLYVRYMYVPCMFHVCSIYVPFMLIYVPSMFRLCSVMSLVPGTWYQVLSTCYLVTGTWYQVQVPGNKYQVLATRYLLPGTACTWYLVPST